MIKIKPRPTSSTEVAAVAPAPKSNMATVNTAAASSSAKPVGFLSSLTAVLSANEDIQDAPRDDFISPRTEKVVPTLFSLKTGVSGVLDGGIIGDKAQREADVMEKHSDHIAPIVTASPESASSSPVQAHAHTVDLHAAGGAVSSKARVRDSTNISNTVVVDSVVWMAAPPATDTGVLRKMSPPKRILARSANKGDGSVFIPVSSLFSAAASSNTVEPVQSQENGDVMGQQCAVPSKPPISPKPRTKTPNRIGVSPAAAREQLAKSKSVEKVIEVPYSTPPALAKVATIDLSKSYLQKQGTPRERHPMEFTPPSCSLGIDKAIDATPVSFVHPQLEEPMLEQPNLQGAKAVKFAEPIVQGILFIFFDFFIVIFSCHLFLL